jgi:hypothetical protein
MEENNLPRKNIAKIIPILEIVFIIFGIYSFIITTGWMGSVPGSLGFVIQMGILIFLFKYTGILLAIGGFILVFSKKIVNKKILIILSSILLLMTVLLFYTEFRVSHFVEEGKFFGSYNQGFRYYLNTLKGIDLNTSNDIFNRANGFKN